MGTSVFILVCGLAWGGIAASDVGPLRERADGNATDFLTPARLAALPPARRIAWTSYVERSRRASAHDRETMAGELRQVQRTTMVQAPYAKAFRVGPEMTAEWFGGAEGLRTADNMLTYQTPAGGWSKHVDVTLHPRAVGESYFSENTGWSYIATIDNDSTTEQIRFLAAAYAAHQLARHRDAVVKGIDFLLEAQFPNGCWPQVYPLQGGYHDAATFNDNAIINVLRLLSDVAGGRVSLAPIPQRRRAADGVAAGLECILASQVLARGEPTIWAQQHDPLTLAPVSARSYELLGLAGRESAWVTSYLMELPLPDARVVKAVNGAVAWFRAHRILGYEYQQYVLKAVPGAGPLWARLTEIDGGRPIFSNRDGIKLYDWDRLTDRRQGYTWFSKEPESTLRQYAIWAPAAGGPTAAAAVVP